MEKIRILLVDDHPVVRTGLRGMLSSQPEFEIVGEAIDGNDGLVKNRELKPDVILTDLRMPNLDGVGMIQALKKEQPDAQILVLTTYDTDADIVRAIEGGAIGYLLKDAPPEELYKAIRSAAKGESFLTPSVAARLIGRMREPEVEQLSRREVEVLNLVADGLSNKLIANKLHISQATVKTHLLRIYNKLGVHDRTSAVTMALKWGILRLENK